MATGVDAKLLKSTKFPPEFNQKVDMQKVNLQVLKSAFSRVCQQFSTGLCVLTADHRWINNKISEILGSEDDVVIELCYNLIEGSRHVGVFFSPSLSLGGHCSSYLPSLANR